MYASSVSIRSGRGQGSHDRVFRFLPLFASQEVAMQYASEQSATLISEFCV